MVLRELVALRKQTASFGVEGLCFIANPEVANLTFMDNAELHFPGVII